MGHVLLRVVRFRVSLFSSARVRKEPQAHRPQVVRRFVRANVVRCTPRVPLRVGVHQVWVDRAWLRRRLQGRRALQAVVRDSATFLVESKKVQ